MSMIYEKLKLLMFDVEKLLVHMIKDSSLSPTAKAKKEAILKQISQVREEYPQFEIKDETYDEGFTAPPEADDEVPQKAAADLMSSNFILSGHLKKKAIVAQPATSPKWWKKAPTDLVTQGRALLGRKTKYFCVIHNGVLYYFDKETDKHQAGHIVLKGYEASAESKKECLFELSGEGKPKHQWYATTEDNLAEWIQAVNQAAGVPETIEEDQEMYEDTAIPDDDADALYEDYDEGISELTSGKTQEPDGDETYDDTNIDNQDFYDDVMSGDSAPPPPASKKPNIAEELSKKLSSPNQSALHSGAVSDAQAPPSLPGRKPGLPPPGDSGGRNLPAVPGSNPPPVPATPRPAGKEGEPDYENLYWGLWDCNAEGEKELTFKRGDKIEIISQKYDCYSWWIGRLNGKVGIVPKDYLARAYELVVH